jgi:hypothetical protein
MTCVETCQDIHAGVVSAVVAVVVTVAGLIGSALY